MTRSEKRFGIKAREDEEGEPHAKTRRHTGKENERFLLQSLAVFFPGVFVPLREPQEKF
jgi:hypothetical protein